ncbi:hypothetical protein DNTS_016429 [Danionella cerebrum]|uniref:Uncharacterized protein n=1 Tax=Danionella cerebrum TaxID=2873325 RepID=A0A553NKH0_9TELE|nr:hypothetical protein DNTS_016429 [Danionella translucida]
MAKMSPPNEDSEPSHEGVVSVGGPDNQQRLADEGLNTPPIQEVDSRKGIEYSVYEAGIDEWAEEFVRHWDAASFKSRNSSPRPDLSPSLSLEPAPSPVYNSVDEEIATLVHRSSQMSNALDVLTEKTDELTRHLEELHNVVVTSATTINTMEDSMDLLFTNVEKLLELFSDFQEENRVEVRERRLAVSLLAALSSTVNAMSRDLKKKGGKN